MNKVKKVLTGIGCAGALFLAGCAGGPDSRSTGQVIDDATIHTKVKAALLNDPVVSGTAIGVDVNKGVVTLDGAVNGEVAKDKAETITRGVDGVKGVDNKIVIRHY